MDPIHTFTLCQNIVNHSLQLFKSFKTDKKDDFANIIRHVEIGFPG